MLSIRSNFIQIQNDCYIKNKNTNYILQRLEKILEVKMETKTNIVKGFQICGNFLNDPSLALVQFKVVLLVSWPPLVVGV